MPPPPTPHVLVMLYVASSLGFERIAYTSFLTYCLSSLGNLFHVLLIIRAPRRVLYGHMLQVLSIIVYVLSVLYVHLFPCVPLILDLLLIVKIIRKLSKLGLGRE